MPVRVQFTLALLLVAFGGAVLAMPAGFEGPPLVDLGTGHAVSPLDLVGAVPLAVGGTWLEILIVVRLPRLRLGPRTLLGLGFAAGLGLGLVLASVYQGYWWWAIGAGAFAVVLAGLTVRALTTTETTSAVESEPPTADPSPGGSPTADLPAAGSAPATGGAPAGRPADDAATARVATAPRHEVPVIVGDPAPAAPGAGSAPEPARPGRRSRKKESPDEFTLGLGD
ncbi:hypothetical protein [Longispora urticae]